MFKAPALISLMPRCNHNRYITGMQFMQELYFHLLISRDTITGWSVCVLIPFPLSLSRSPAISLGEPFRRPLMTQNMSWSAIHLQAQFKNSLIEISVKIPVIGNICALPMMALLLQQLLLKWNPDFQISLTLMGLPFYSSSHPENHSCQANSAQSMCLKPALSRLHHQGCTNLQSLLVRQVMVSSSLSKYLSLRSGNAIEMIDTALIQRVNSKTEMDFQNNWKEG